jgi:Resolvase, N terminal domain
MRELMLKGDVIVVWQLDRLGRSLRHLIDVMTELEQQGIGFQSLQEAINTTTPEGILIDSGRVDDKFLVIHRPRAAGTIIRDAVILRM